MHVNDVYALRTFLKDLLEKGKVDTRTARALMEAATEEVAAFEQHLEEMALAEEAAQQ
jgi:ribosomal protein L19E